MASSSTERKIYRQEAGKVITVNDMQAHTQLAYDLDTEDNWALLSEEDGVVGGFAITHNSGNDFDVSKGIAIDGGEVLKNTSIATLTLDDNPDPSNTRVDLIVIDGYSESMVDNSTDKVLSSVSLNTVTGSSIGTGDGVTQTFGLSSKVILRTLEVFLDGNPSSDWVFMPEGGTGTQDAVWFSAPPGVGVNVTTNHKYVVGGEEQTPGVPYKTRFQRNANVVVKKGTPGSPTALPAGNILLGSVTLPVLWAGGAAGVTIINTTKHFIANTDSENDEENSPFDRPARISDAIRNAGQVRQGCRLRYVSSDTIAVGPGWINHMGLSMRVKSDVTLQLQTSNAANPGYVGGGANSWVYVYAVPPDLSSGGRPGEPFSLDTSFSPPNSLGHCTESPLPFTGFYLGAVYLTGVGPVAILPFYRDGDMVMWVVPGLVTMTSGANSDIAHLVPSTARLVYGQLYAAWDPDAVGDTCLAEIYSHAVLTANPHPKIVGFDKAVNGSAGHLIYQHGFVRAEQVGDQRRIHANVTLSAGSLTGIYFYVMGYIEDYGTMSTSGIPLTY